MQTFMEIEDGQLVEVQFEGNNLLELSLSPQNLNSAYRQLVSDGEAVGVDNIETSELLPYLILYYFLHPCSALNSRNFISRNSSSVKSEDLVPSIRLSISYSIKSRISDL